MIGAHRRGMCPYVNLKEPFRDVFQSILSNVFEMRIEMKTRSPGPHTMLKWKIPNFRTGKRLREPPSGRQATLRAQAEPATLSGVRGFKRLRAHLILSSF